MFLKDYYPKLNKKYFNVKFDGISFNSAAEKLGFVDGDRFLSIDNTEKVNLLSYQLIIIGASIRYGKHQASVYNFIKNTILIILYITFFLEVIRLEFSFHFE